MTLQQWFKEELAETDRIEQEEQEAVRAKMADLMSQIKTAMKNKGMKQRQLAERLGVSRSYVSRLFYDPHNMSIGKLIELGAVVGLEVDIRYKRTRRNNE